MMSVVEDDGYSHLAKLAMVELLFGFHNTENGRCDPSAKTVGGRLDRHERKIRGAIGELEAGGQVVSQQRGRTSSSYSFPGLDRPFSAGQEPQHRPSDRTETAAQEAQSGFGRPKTAAKPILIIDSESGERERASEEASSRIEVIAPSITWGLTEAERQYARNLGLSDDEIDDEVDKLVEFRIRNPGYPTRTWFQRAADYKKRHPRKPKSMFEHLRVSWLRAKTEEDRGTGGHKRREERVWVSQLDRRWPELAKKHGGSRGCATDRDGGWWFPRSWLEPVTEAAE